MTAADSRPASSLVLVAVMMTVAWGLIVFWVLLANSKTEYRQAHNLQPRFEKTWLGGTRYAGEARVKFSDLDPETRRLLLIAPLLVILIHPVVGRIVCAIGRGLTKLWDVVFGQEHFGTWSPSASLIFGTLWPISVLTLPCFVVGIVLGGLYRSLWRA